jgi:hypothetical protein
MWTSLLLALVYQIKRTIKMSWQNPKQQKPTEEMAQKQNEPTKTLKKLS